MTDNKAENKKEELNNTNVAVETTTTEVPKVEIKQYDNEDLFVTEKTTFEAKVRYYRNEQDEFVVEGVSDEFDEKKDYKEIVVTCKYPSQSDYQSLLNSPSFKNLGDLKAVDVVLLELTRLSLLIRNWSLKQDLSRIMEMDPRIVKGILWSISQKIGMQGIF